MIEEILDITTADGAMETFVCRPGRDAPHPAMLKLSIDSLAPVSKRITPTTKFSPGLSVMR